MWEIFARNAELKGLKLDVGLFVDSVQVIFNGERLRPPTMVMSDAKRLIQVLFALVHNAIKFTASGGIEVSGNYSVED